MAATVSVLFLLEDDSQGEETLAALGAVFQRRRLEATILITGSRARELRVGSASGVIRLGRELDVAFHSTATFAAASSADPQTSAEAFLAEETSDYESVVFLAGRIPSCYVARAVPPQAYGPLAEWNVRSVVASHGCITNGGRPYFLGGRLHLSELADNWFAPADELSARISMEDLAARITERVAAARAPGGVVCVHLHPSRLTPASAPHLETLLHRIEESGAVVRSVRQAADRLADISHEHAVSLANIQKAAQLAARGGPLRPIAYDLGYFSPSEQIYVIVALWEATLKKGKIARNATMRTPLGPRHAFATDPAVTEIPGDMVQPMLGDLLRIMQGRNELPPLVTLPAGKIAINDLLPTLAAGFEQLLPAGSLPVRQGFLSGGDLVQESSIARLWPDATLEEVARLAEMYRLQLWTFKPVVDLEPPV